MGLVVATLIVIVVIAAIIAQEPAIFSWAYWQQGGGGTSRSEVVRNIVLGAVALVALVVGILRVWTAHRQARAAQEQAMAANEQATAANEQARISEQGHITDRYAKAVEMLSNDNAYTRTGAVYALARIAQDSVERDHIPVMMVLSEFVRNPPYIARALERAEAREKAKARQEALEDGTPRVSDVPPAIKCPDVIAALRSIAVRNAAQEAFENSVGYEANFMNANLQELDLEGAPLINANLMRANLTGTSLRLGFLNGVDLRSARLTDADFDYADLIDANLTLVDELDGGNFVDAILAGANLSLSDLTGADLTDADLTGADLTDADLRRVRNLTQQQLDSAVWNPERPPELPPGLVLPASPAVAKDENDKRLSES